MIRYIAVSVLILVFLVVMVATCRSAVAQNTTASSEAEQYILTAIAKGDVADLKKAFTNPADRVVSAAFLEDLLTSSTNKVHRKGVRISGATVTNKLDLTRANVVYDTYLDSCQFTEPVDLHGSHFQKDLSFTNSTLADINCDEIRVDGDIDFEKARLKGVTSFSRASIKGVLNCNDAHFENANSKVNFQAATLGHVFLNNAVFMGGVDFKSAKIAGWFNAVGTHFENSNMVPVFQLMAVGQNAFFTGAVFKGGVDFTAANITGFFVVDNARFKNTNINADFGAITVGQTASFSKAIFEGEVNFFAANIAGYLQISGTHFENQAKEASFLNMKVGQEIQLNRNTIFRGGVDFRGAYIVGNFNAGGAHFDNTGKVARFERMKVDQNVNITNTVFRGGVNFTGASIAGYFDADDASFENATSAANFNSMQVGGHASFIRAVFKGKADFTAANIAGQFIAEEIRFESPAETVSFNGMTVRQYADFERATFQGPVDFGSAYFVGAFGAANAKFLHDANLTGIKVDGSANFGRAEFSKRLYLQDAKFMTVDLSEMILPLEENSVVLYGTTYEHIVRGEKNATWERDLKGLLGKAEYSPDVYIRLEDYFRRHGESEQADRICYEQNYRKRCKARNELGILRSLPKVSGNLLLSYTVRYGRHPSLALVWMGAFVVFGYLVFRGCDADGNPKKMEQQKSGEAPRVWNAFWYSLDLFVPMIDLQSANFWMPKKESLARHYMLLHRIAGWLLIPIVVAALTGIIK